MDVTASRTGFPAVGPAPFTRTAPATQQHSQVIAGRTNRRRRLDRQSGQAIELLGHAIQYLADEFALDCLYPAVRNASGKSPRIEAIELLMSFNRQIYMSCPVVPTLSERLRAVFRG